MARVERDTLGCMIKRGGAIGSDDGGVSCNVPPEPRRVEWREPELMLDRREPLTLRRFVGGCQSKATIIFSKSRTYVPWYRRRWDFVATIKSQ